MTKIVSHVIKCKDVKGSIIGLRGKGPEKYGTWVEKAKNVILEIRRGSKEYVVIGKDGSQATLKAKPDRDNNWYLTTAQDDSSENNLDSVDVELTENCQAFI